MRVKYKVTVNYVFRHTCVVRYQYYLQGYGRQNEIGLDLSVHDVPLRLLPERTGMMCFEYHPSVLSSAGNGWCLHKNRSHLSSRTSGGNKKT